MSKCDPNGPLMIYVSNVFKIYKKQKNSEGQNFTNFAYGRIFSGKISKNEKVFVIGPDHHKLVF